MDISQVHPTDREDAYEAVLRDAWRKPFAWGTHDCVTFAASVIKARTGRDELGNVTWTDALDAMRKVEELGGLRAELTRRFGEPVAILQAHTGDPVLVRNPDGRELLAIKHQDVLIAPAPDGLARFAFKHAICAWRVS